MSRANRGAATEWALLELEDELRSGRAIPRARTEVPQSDLQADYEVGEWVLRIRVCHGVWGGPLRVAHPSLGVLDRDAPDEDVDVWMEFDDTIRPRSEAESWSTWRLGLHAPHCDRCGRVAKRLWHDGGGTLRLCSPCGGPQVYRG